MTVDCETTATVYGPCAPYVGLDDLPCAAAGGLDIGTENEPGADRQLALDACVWASRRVYLATGQRFTGCCESTIYPCRERRSFGYTIPGSFPSGWPWSSGWSAYGELPYAFMDGLVPVWTCGCAGDICSCTSWDRVALPVLPVRWVDEVRIDGVVLDPAKWSLYQGAWLLRIDGQDWPQCQAVEKIGTGDPVGTWSIKLHTGWDLPPEGKPLVASYACQLASRVKGSDCDLPAGIQVVQRDGVQFGVVEPAEYRALGLTGYGPVDDWVALLNGGHVTEAPRLYRPGQSMPNAMEAPRW